MEMGFIIPVVGDALGHTLYAEQYKGNFRLAQAQAEQALAEAQRQPDPRQLADALLARGMVHLMQGEAGAALARFTDYFNLAGQEPAGELRALNYQYRAKEAQYNLFPGEHVAIVNNEIELRRPSDLWQKQVKQYSQRTESLSQTLANPTLNIENGALAYLSQNRLSRQMLAPGNSRSMAAAATFTALIEENPRKFDTPPPIRAYRYTVSATIAARKLNFERAGALLQEAITLYNSLNDKAGLALCALTRGDWLAAPYSGVEMMNASLDDNISDSNLRVEIEKFEMDDRTLDYAQSESYYREAEGLFRQAGAERGVGASLLRRAYCAARSGDYGVACNLVMESHQTFERVGDILNQCVAQAHLVLYQIGHGQVPATRTLMIAQTIGNWGRERGSFSFAMGIGILFSRIARRWLVREGDAERALACFRLAEVLYVALGAKSKAIVALTDQGQVYRQLGDVNAAAERYNCVHDEAMAIVSETTPFQWWAWSQAVKANSNLADIYTDAGDPDGLTLIGQRLLALTKIAPTGSTLGKVKEGLRFIGTLVKQVMSKESELMGQEQMVKLQTLAILDLNLKNSTCLVPLLRARQAREVDDAPQLQRWIAEMRVASQTHNFFPYQYECAALAFEERFDAAAAVMRQYDQVEQQKLEHQRASYSASLSEIAQQQQWQHHDTMLTAFINCKAYADGYRHLQAVEALMGEEWWQVNRRPWETLMMIGELYEGLGQYTNALAAYDRGIALVEQHRIRLTQSELKRALSGQNFVRDLYLGAARTAFKVARQVDDLQVASYQARAFSYSEQGKARTLLDLMADDQPLIAARLGEVGRRWVKLQAQATLWRELLAQERQRQDPPPNPVQVATLQQSLADNQRDLAEMEEKLAMQDPTFLRLLSPTADTLSVEAVQELLTPGTLLLQYFYAGNDLLAWAISTRGIVHTHHITLRVPHLNRTIKAFHQACANGRAVAPFDSELADILLSPFAAYLPDYSHLIIVPYGSSHLLPFHALPWQGSWLGNSHMISYAPSASALAYLPRQTGLNTRAILAVGNPSAMQYTSPDQDPPQPLTTLPYAATEARAIAALFDKGLALTGSEANKNVVHAHLPHYAIHHFATHGIISAKNPLLSSIQLAAGESLTVLDLTEMHLDADLVILSACDTGQGKNTAGDDVVGLTQGLLAAGVRAAVVTLWPVDDRLTCLFMVQFYRHLRTGAGLSECLQQAQIYLQKLTPTQADTDYLQLQIDLEVPSTLQELQVNRGSWDLESNKRTVTADYSHPFYWGAFVVISKA